MQAKNLFVALLSLTLSLSGSTFAQNSAEISSFASEIGAIKTALASYSAAHTPDAAYSSIRAFLATQTAVPSASIVRAEAGLFFTDLVPPRYVSALPQDLQSYASAYLAGVSALESSVVGTNTGDFSFTFGEKPTAGTGPKGGSTSASASVTPAATTTTTTTPAPSSSSSAGAAPAAATGFPGVVVAGGMLAGVLGVAGLL